MLRGEADDEDLRLLQKLPLHSRDDGGDREEKRAEEEKRERERQMILD